MPRQVRSDHHRWQWALGGAQRAAGRRGAPGGRRHGQGAAARRGRAGDRGADRLLLLDRELVAPAEEVGGLMRMFGERIAGRRRSCTRRACGCASSAAARGSTPALVERMEWAEARLRERPRHPVRRLQLRRQGGDRRRGAKLPGGLRGGVPPSPLRARDARPRPPDHEPAASSASPTTCSGSAPTRSWSSRRALAGLHRGAFEASLGEYESPAAPLRGEGLRMSDSSRRRRSDAAGRGAASAPPKSSSTASTTRSPRSGRSRRRASRNAAGGARRDRQTDPRRGRLRSPSRSRSSSPAGWSSRSR